MSEQDRDRDKRLLRRLAGGDVNALGEIYDRHALTLYRWLLSRDVPRTEAQDILQECFLALVDRGERAAAIEDVGGYLFAVARNKLSARYRRPPTGSLELIDEPESGNSADPEAMAVREALTALPPEQREVVVLKVWQGHTFAEIGSLLSISPNTASSRYRYALQKLRKELGESEYG
ncbi:MAG: sigma-70 family RNA polymerase sigma factor [Armatimonadota bacterium]|nr:sigma-70 family RNA polymerase sigma factor [Armatimonadota bacterium]